jgi:sialate O-acetylesterase
MTPPGFLRTTRAPGGAGRATALDLTALPWFGLKADEGEDAAPPAADARWQPVTLPGYVNDQRPAWRTPSRALFWYRARLVLPAAPAGPAWLCLGAIDDEDEAFVNGRAVGHTGRDTNVNDWQLAPRRYALPAGLLAAGTNEILVRVTNLDGKSGITAGPVQVLVEAPETGGDETTLALAAQPPLDLAGRWLGASALPNEREPPLDGDPRWRPVRVPGTFEEQHEAWGGYDGVFWYRRDFDARKIPAGARPVLLLGAVDDEDETRLNGRPIGRTDATTNPRDYWTAPRVYPLPAGLLQAAGNRLIVRVNDLRASGGITTAPVHLVWVPPAEAAQARLAGSPYLFEVGRGDDPYCYQGW